MGKAKTAEWYKAPSVTYGGKQYFYTAILKGKRFWVVWDRVVCKWAVTVEAQGGQTTLTHVKSPEAGKRYAKKLTELFAKKK